MVTEESATLSPNDSFGNINPIKLQESLSWATAFGSVVLQREAIQCHAPPGTVDDRRESRSTEAKFHYPRCNAIPNSCQRSQPSSHSMEECRGESRRRVRDPINDPCNEEPHSANRVAQSFPREDQKSAHHLVSLVMEVAETD